jgi:hypothetical protein
MTQPPQAIQKSNSHIHLPPNFSAFDTVRQAVELAAEQDVRICGVSNYYDYSVQEPFARACQEQGIVPVFGLEIISLIDDLVQAGVLINDPSNPGRCYLCGKGVVELTHPSPRAAELLATIRQRDTTRMKDMVQRVAAIFTEAGLEQPLDDEAIISQIAARHGLPENTVTLQERHIAMAFQQAVFTSGDRAAILAAAFSQPATSDLGDAVAVQGEIRSRLMKSGKPAFVKETFLSFDQAKELILALGGIPCYPTLADGVHPICEYEQPVGQLIERLQTAGIPMAEYIPLRNTPEVLEAYVTAVREAGIVVVGGTEHNTLDLLPMDPRCLKGAPLPDAVREIFWEGICVTVAHQECRMKGEPGFVDAQGEPNPHYETTEDRIAAFADLGAKVIASHTQRDSS